jgi:hypothetical protein
MGEPPLTDHQLKTWNTLVGVIKKRLVARSRAPILFGDLSQIIFGRRNGAQSFRWSLWKIHDRTSQYNKKFKTKHPLLNALVVNQKGEHPGIPKSQNPDEIWNVLEQSGHQYLDRLAVLLGYADFSGDRSGSEERHSGRAEDSAGAQDGGKRSAATWSARHSPYVKEIGRILDKLGWKQKIPARPWHPDMLRGSPTGGKRVLIEVKPDCGEHNVITAIGQVICYSSGMKNVIKVIAIPGSNSLKSHMKNVLESNDIKILDLDEADLLGLVRVIVEENLAT